MEDKKRGGFIIDFNGKSRELKIEEIAKLGQSKKECSQTMIDILKEMGKEEEPNGR